MKHLKKFENFILPENNWEEDEQDYLLSKNRNNDEDCVGDDCDDEDMADCEDDDCDFPRRRVIGDEVVERKKSPFKKKIKDDEKKSKPKGLTAAQKKLPKALQDSILKRQK